MDDDTTYIPNMPPLVSPVRARNIARLYKGLADGLRHEGLTREASQADQTSAWFMTYAIALSQVELPKGCEANRRDETPGRIDDGDMP